MPIPRTVTGPGVKPSFSQKALGDLEILTGRWIWQWLWEKPYKFEDGSYLGSSPTIKETKFWTQIRIITFLVRPFPSFGINLSPGRLLKRISLWWRWKTQGPRLGSNAVKRSEGDSLAVIVNKLGAVLTFTATGVSDHMFQRTGIVWISWHRIKSNIRMSQCCANEDPLLDKTANHIPLFVFEERHWTMNCDRRWSIIISFEFLRFTQYLLPGQYWSRKVDSVDHYDQLTP